MITSAYQVSIDALTFICEMVNTTVDILLCGMSFILFLCSYFPLPTPQSASADATTCSCMDFTGMPFSLGHMVANMFLDTCSSQYVIIYQLKFEAVKFKGMLNYYRAHLCCDVFSMQFFSYCYLFIAEGGENINR